MRTNSEGATLAAPPLTRRLPQLVLVFAFSVFTHCPKFL